MLFWNPTLCGLQQTEFRYSVLSVFKRKNWRGKSISQDGNLLDTKTRQAWEVELLSEFVTVQGRRRLLSKRFLTTDSASHGFHKTQEIWGKIFLIKILLLKKFHWSGNNLWHWLARRHRENRMLLKNRGHKGNKGKLLSIMGKLGLCKGCVYL